MLVSEVSILLFKMKMLSPNLKAMKELILTSFVNSLGYCVLVGHGLSILSNWKTATVDGNQTDLNASAEHDNNEKCHSGYRRLLAAALVSLVVLFMLRTINRNKVWKNRETLFRCVGVNFFNSSRLSNIIAGTCAENCFLLSFWHHYLYVTNTQLQKHHIHEGYDLPRETLSPDIL